MRRDTSRRPPPATAAPSPPAAADPHGLGPDAAAYARAAFAQNTRRAYRADLAHFAAWCDRAGQPWMPAAPRTLADYLAACATVLKVATLRRRLAAIGRAHAIAGHDPRPLREVARTVMAGIAALHGAPPRQAAALTTADLQRLVATCDDTPQGRRDRALLLVGYAGALRRSELAGIRGGHLRPGPEGMELTLPRSKGDQAGEGQRIGIPRGARAETCPVGALEAWLALAPAGPGDPVFRKIVVTRAGAGAAREARHAVQRAALHPDSVRLILRRRAAAAGLEALPEAPISPHGLRAGFVTQAYRAGVTDEAIMAHTRHRDLRTMRGYVRRAGLVAESPARRLGL